MTTKEAVNWLINITADIGKAEHRSLWHYEQALDEIRELLESMPTIEPERKKGKRYAERDCDNCKHRKDNGCEVWDCKFEAKEKE